MLSHAPRQKMLAHTHSRGRPSRSLHPSARHPRGNDPENEAARVFAQRFEEGRIKGTGHLFSIVIDCDRERLKVLSAALGKNESKVVEYDFTFVQNTKQKSKARIEHSGLSAATARCIIDSLLQRGDILFRPIDARRNFRPHSFPCCYRCGQATDCAYQPQSASLTRSSS